MLPFELTKDTPYLALSGELWSVFYEYFNRNWSCYKGFLLYSQCAWPTEREYKRNNEIYSDQKAIIGLTHWGQVMHICVSKLTMWLYETIVLFRLWIILSCEIIKMFPLRTMSANAIDYLSGCQLDESVSSLATTSKLQLLFELCLWCWSMKCNLLEIKLPSSL